MPPIIKENESLAATTESSPRSGSATSNGDAAKQQPVALEVAVTVNGARAVDGSDKREPFSETTKTVLIFGSGAVIRLTSSVAPGQLLFLTNERTKKEVVCQVVKSKNYRNVSGYVELEFTEPVVGFWGMRFPGDRLGPAPQATATSIPPAAAGGSPAAPRAVTPSAVAPPAPPRRMPAPLYSGSSSPSLSSDSGLTSSIVPPALDSASLLGATKPKAAEIHTPAAPLVPPPVKAAPPAPAEPTHAAPDSATVRTFEISSRPDEQASFLAPNPKVGGSVDLSSLAPFFDVKPAAPAAVPPPAPPKPVATDPETEELKQHTARLQEQLSSMLFTEAQPSQPAKAVSKRPAVVAPEKKELQESIAQVLEMAKPSSAEVEDLFEAPTEPAKTATERKVSSIENEELKIPAWLEPLARNASAPSSTQELVLREKTKRRAEQTSNEEIANEPAAAPIIPAPEEEAVAEPRMPEFGATLAIDEEKPAEEPRATDPSRSLLFGAIAAGLVLAVAGGWWFLNQRSASTPASETPAPTTSASSVPTTVPTKPQGEATVAENLTAQPEAPVAHGSQAHTGAARQSNTNASSAAAAPALSVASLKSAQPSPNSAGKGNAGGASSSPQPEAASAEPKKPILGDVHLARPKVSQNRNAQSNAESDAGVSLDAQAENNADALGASLSAGGKEPAAPTAPLPVGGDVKQARLISKVDAVYPMLAKNQHVSGNVLIDALIDENGRVTTMKVMSGPTLLHQAAMDALKQWKYQPATLDGKAVPMHLTVTLQFRLQ